MKIPPVMEPITIIDENFNSGNLPTGWTVEVLTGIGSNTWSVGTSNAMGSDNAAVVTFLPGAGAMDVYDSSDPNDNSNDIILRTPLINANSITDLRLTFAWGAGGESDASNPPLLDYGSLVYSFNGINYFEIGDPFAGDGVVLLTPAAGNFDMMLDFLDGEAFYLGFRWINDQLLAGAASFSVDDILLTGVTASLPVEMLAFQAQLVEQDEVELKWQTTNENDHQGFEILRSFDGELFEKIGFTPAQEKGKAINEYIFQDQDLKNGIHYYRLRQVDNHGKRTDSKIVSVKVEKAETVFQIYPNQVKENFTVQFEQATAAHATLQLLDMSGKLITRIALLEGVLQQNIDIANLNLAAGTYLLSLHQNGNIYTQILIKD